MHQISSTEKATLLAAVCRTIPVAQIAAAHIEAVVACKAEIPTFKDGAEAQAHNGPYIAGKITDFDTIEENNARIPARRVAKLSQDISRKRSLNNVNILFNSYVDTAMVI